jgi:hypothetical protein
MGAAITRLRAAMTIEMLLTMSIVVKVRIQIGRCMKLVVMESLRFCGFEKDKRKENENLYLRRIGRKEEERTKGGQQLETRGSPQATFAKW